MSRSHAYFVHLEAALPSAKIDAAQGGPAPAPTHCVVIGSVAGVRLAFLAGEEDDGSLSVLSAVTLSRSQLTGLAGMLAAIIDTDDRNAISLN